MVANVRRRMTGAPEPWPRPAANRAGGGGATGVLPSARQHVAHVGARTYTPKGVRLDLRSLLDQMRQKPGSAVAGKTGGKGPARTASARADPAYASHAARRRDKALGKVEALWEALPCKIAAELAGGEIAARQVPDPERRKALVLTRWVAKAGPEGASAAKALRSWRLLEAVAEERGLPEYGLPAGGLLVADIVAADLARARAASTGSRGGVTVGKTIADGFEWLESIGLPIEASHPAVQAAAVPAEAPTIEGSRRTHASSVPLCLYLQLETLAAAPDASIVRFMARCFVSTVGIHHIRLNDALNTKLFPDEKEPEKVARGTTLVPSKDALPIELYAPMRGLLGSLDWMPGHVKELSTRSHAIPDFDSPKAGDPTRATHLAAGVISPARARTCLQILASLPPLRMSPEEFKALKLTTHSWHGTAADIVRFLAACGYPMRDSDADVLGHWMRRKKPEASNVRRGEGEHDDAPQRAKMRFRYSQGAGRRGERAEQLEARTRLMNILQRAVGKLGDWARELPHSCEDWDWLAPDGVEGALD